MNREAAISELCATYQEVHQIGLVVGAGVSRDSGVPLYGELAIQLIGLARQQHKLKGVPDSVLEFLAEQEPGLEADPDKILQYLCDHLASHDSLRRLVKEVLYRGVDTHKSHKMVGARTYLENPTLNAVISFCAAPPGSPLAPNSTGRWETNPKVGGILTTNYDNLVEGAFGSKYGKSLLKPVAREGARERMPGKRVIPVYHMHGYVSYVDDPNTPDQVKASELVIAEEDYYRTFYNLLGFSNVVAVSFLRQFPCIFVGCSMLDRNIRRILYHLRRERIGASAVYRHFAILPPRAEGEQDLDDAVLASFGVTAIRLDDDCHMGVQIEAILKRVWQSLDGVSEAHWLAARQGSWARRADLPD